MTLPKLTRCSWIKNNRVFHIADSDVALVLYLDVMPFESGKRIPTPKMVEPEKWRLIYHQTGGYLCAHKHIYAMFLEPNARFLPLLSELSSAYLESCISDPPALSAAVQYEAVLGKYNISAERSYCELQEAFYPIDITFAHEMSKTPLPEKLNDLLVPEKNPIPFLSFGPEWKLAILGENCD